MGDKVTGNEPIYGTLKYLKYGPYKTEEVSQSPGLTIRQHFAAMAMQGLISGAETMVPLEKLAYDSVRVADALITELNK